MSILSVAEAVALKIGIEVPGALYTSTEREHVELRGVLAEAAERVLCAHDWQRNKARGVITGDGTTEEWPLPSDFFRWPKDARMWSSRIETAMTFVPSADDWLQLEVHNFEAVQNLWTRIGNKILIRPALGAGETAQYYYQSRNVISGGTKAAFTADTDTFDLGERLLKLASIWEWKSGKNLPYAEDMANYEHALAEAIGQDGGPRTLAIGRKRGARMGTVSYPQRIVP